MATNKVKLNIAGAQYSVLSEEDEKYVQLLGKELDLKMAEVMKAYGFDVKTMTGSSCVAELMKMYQEWTK